MAERPEVDLFDHIVERRHHHIGNDRRNLGIELEERVQQSPHADDPLDGGEDVAEDHAGAIDLPFFALEEGDLLAELADARQIESKIRLDRLLAKQEPRQGMADELHHARGETGVENGDPEQKAGNLDSEDRQVHAP